MLQVFGGRLKRSEGRRTSAKMTRTTSSSISGRPPLKWEEMVVGGDTESFRQLAHAEMFRAAFLDLRGGGERDFCPRHSSAGARFTLLSCESKHSLEVPAGCVGGQSYNDVCEVASG